MKKAISLVIILFGIYLIYQFAIINFKSTHSTEYTINNEQIVFNVKEEFKNNKYFFEVNIDNYKFIFDKKNDSNKKRNIIKNIEYVSDNNIGCIYPVYENSTSSVICANHENIYSYESVKNNDLVENFVTMLKDKSYTSDSFETPEYESDDSKIQIYYKYIEDEIINIWNYTGVSVINNDRRADTEVLDFDRYENTLATTVDKYYIMPVYLNNNLFEVNKFFAINLTTNETYEILLPFTLSNRSYINGVINNKLYIFDKTNMKQIEINPSKKEALVVGDEKTNCKYYDNTWETRNIYDFVNNNIKFNNVHYEDIKNHSYDQAFETKNSYYIYHNNTMYQVYKNNLENKITLFTEGKIKEIIVKEDNIYYIKGDTLYRYNNKYGIRKLLTYDEFKYNYKNIVSIYK